MKNDSLDTILGAVAMMAGDAPKSKSTVRDIVQKHKDSCKHNAKILADKILTDLRVMNYTDDDLIEVYKEMSVCNLSPFELECLTKKKLQRNMEGYYLEDVDHLKDIDDNVNSIFNQIKEGK